MDAVALAPVLEWTYETQLLEFHPHQLIDGMYNVFYENVFEILNHLQSYLCKEFKEIVSTETIRSETDLMFQILRKKLDKAIDKFEIYVCRNFLCISENVVLPEDKVHTMHSCTEDEELKIDQEIEELKQQIIKEKVRKSILKQKKAEQKIVKENLASLLEKLEDVSNILKQGLLTKEALDVILNEYIKSE